MQHCLSIHLVFIGSSDNPFACCSGSSLHERSSRVPDTVNAGGDTWPSPPSASTGLRLSADNPWRATCKFKLPHVGYCGQYEVCSHWESSPDAPGGRIQASQP